MATLGFFRGAKTREALARMIRRQTGQLQGRLLKGEIPEDYQSPIPGQLSGWHTSTYHPIHTMWRLLPGEETPAWAKRGRLNLRKGEGFGLHMGTPQSAIERGEAYMGERVNDAHRRAIMLDIVARPGRGITFERDIGNWGYPFGWFTQLERGAIQGLKHSEAYELRQLLTRLIADTGLYDDRAGAIRRALLKKGIDRVYYPNAYEDAGSTSVALLDPRKIRWGSRAAFDPERQGVSNLLAGVGGAAGGTEMLRRALSERVNEERA